MDTPAERRISHLVNGALGKTRLALEVLQQHTTLSDQQVILVNAALVGLNELDAILRDDVNRQLIGLASVSTHNANQTSSATTPPPHEAPHAAVRGRCDESSQP